MRFGGAPGFPDCVFFAHGFPELVLQVLIFDQALLKRAFERGNLPFEAPDLMLKLDPLDG